LTQKMLHPFITPRTLQMYLRQSILCSSSWKWTQLCGCSEIQEAVTDTLKKVQKNFRQLS
jgi:hypothetical protein